jgi:hypothetical protein
MFLTVASIYCTQVLTKESQDSVLSIVYHKTINNVTITARIIPDKESKNLFGFTIQDKEVCAIAFSIKNLSKKSLIISHDSFVTKGLIDTKDLLARESAANAVAIVLPFISWGTAYEEKKIAKIIKDFSIDSPVTLQPNGYLEAVIFIDTKKAGNALTTYVLQFELKNEDGIKHASFQAHLTRQ